MLDGIKSFTIVQSLAKCLAVRGVKGVISSFTKSSQALVSGVVEAILLRHGSLATAGLQPRRRPPRPARRATGQASSDTKNLKGRPIPPLAGPFAAAAAPACAPTNGTALHHTLFTLQPISFTFPKRIVKKPWFAIRRIDFFVVASFVTRHRTLFSPGHKHRGERLSTCQSAKG